MLSERVSQFAFQWPKSLPFSGPRLSMGGGGEVAELQVVKMGGGSPKMVIRLFV